MAPSSPAACGLDAAAHPGRSTSGLPGRGERPQHVELIAIWVGHGDPADLALADADPAGAERLQPCDLCA